MSNVTDTENRPMRDYNIGRRFIKAETNVGGKIVERAGPTYVIKWDDGTDGFVRVDDLEAADDQARKEMIAKGEREREARFAKLRQQVAGTERQAPTARSPSLASQAAEKLAMLQAIRAGLDLDPKAPDFSQRVAARLKQTDAPGSSQTAKAPRGMTLAARGEARSADAAFQTNVDAALRARLRFERER